MKRSATTTTTTEPPTKKAKDGKLPVLLLSGFLGAGKTTLLKHILTNVTGQRVAVVVNDMAELNVDAHLVEGLVQRNQELVQMQNGCICCTLRVDLIEEVARLAKAGKYDALVIESTGISEPMQVAETFAAELPSEVLAEQQKGNDAALALGSLHEVARLDSCTTVIDASTFFDMFENAKTVQEDAMGQEEHLEEGDDRNLVGLLTEQVEFADLIVLNKTDLLSVLQLNKVRTAVKIMNPHARIVDSSFGKVPLETLLNTSRFDMEACTKWVDHGSRWFAELPGSHNPESLEYGVGSFIYRNANKPFHPKRLYEWVGRVFNVTASQAVLTSHDNYEQAAAAQEVEVEEEKDTATRATGATGATGEEAENNEEGGNVEAGEDDDEVEVEDVEDDEAIDDEDVEDDGSTYFTGASLRKSWKEMMGDDSRLLRSKGCVWMAGVHSHNFRIVWGHTGPYLHLEVDDPWKTVGQSPRTELVMIGQDLDQAKLSAELDACLLTEEEMVKFNAGPEEWGMLEGNEDPLQMVVMQ